MFNDHILVEFVTLERAGRVVFWEYLDFLSEVVHKFGSADIDRQLTRNGVNDKLGEDSANLIVLLINFVKFELCQHEG